MQGRGGKVEGSERHDAASVSGADAEVDEGEAAQGRLNMDGLYDLAIDFFDWLREVFGIGGSE